MRWITVALLSLVLGMPVGAYAGHWIIEETDSRYLVEYVQDLTDQIPRATLPKSEQLQQPLVLASASPTGTADAGQQGLRLAPQDPKRAEEQQRYYEKRNEEREARRQERAALRQDREARRQDREARRQ